MHINIYIYVYAFLGCARLSWKAARLMEAPQVIGVSVNSQGHKVPMQRVQLRDTKRCSTSAVKLIVGL